MRIRRQWGLALSLAVLMVAAQACDSKPPQGERKARQPAVATAKVPKPTTPPAPSNQPVGRWRGERTCLELFANGDAEISLHGNQPKVLVMGRAETSEQTEGGFRVAVSNVKIWKGRFLGPCRKVHETGAFTDHIDVLGTPVAIDKAASFTMKKLADGAWELCGERCERLVPDEPLLGARWRRADPRAREPGSQYARSSDMIDSLGESWQVGALLDLKLNESSPHIWIGGPGKEPIRVAATISVRFEQSDRFLVEATPTEVPAADALPSPSLLGLPVQVGVALTLRAQRLANQELEVCGAATQCQILQRQFDSYSYELH